MQLSIPARSSFFFFGLSYGAHALIRARSVAVLESLRSLRSLSQLFQSKVAHALRQPSILTARTLHSPDLIIRSNRPADRQSDTAAPAPVVDLTCFGFAPFTSAAQQRTASFARHNTLFFFFAAAHSASLVAGLWLFHPDFCLFFFTRSLEVRWSSFLSPPIVSCRCNLSGTSCCFALGCAAAAAAGLELPPLSDH